jgi:hypothetical protein
MNKSKLHKITAVLFALLFWQTAAMILNRSFLLSSPTEVLKALLELGFSSDFWTGMWKSVCKIVLGFLTGAGVGIFLAGLSYRFKLFEIYTSPYIMVIRSIPVASFVIIILIWLGGGGLSLFVCFFMVMPIFYANTLEGLKSVDVKMLQMAKIFEMSNNAKLIYIYLPALESFLLSASVASIGIAFKSGIAAEVIGRPKDTLGFFLFDAKMYLDTSKVFAITLTVIICSAVFERLAVLMIKRFFYMIKRIY